MSFVNVVPELIGTSATQLADIGAAVDTAGAAALAPISGIAAPAADEVSAAITALFDANAREFQVASAQAAAFHTEFTNLLNGGAVQYLSTEVVNARQTLVGAVNTSAMALLGHPLIGEPATGANSAASTATTSQLAGTGGAASSSDNSAALTSAGASSSVEQSPVTASIPVGTYPVASVVVPDGHGGYRVYVASQSGQSVSVIDAATNTLIGSPISLGLLPHQIVASADGRQIYVSGENGFTGPNVYAIDPVTHAVTPVPGGISGQGWQLAMAPDGNKLYVAGDSKVFVVDTASNTIINPSGIPIIGAHSMVVTPDGGTVYVKGNVGIAVVETAHNTVVGAIPADYGYALAISPDGRFLYSLGDVTSGPTVSVIDTSTNTVVGEPIAIPGLQSSVFPSQSQNGLTLSPDGRYLYVPGDWYDAAGSHGSVSIIDTASHAVISTIPAGESPSAVALSPDGRYAYVADRSSSMVTVVDTANGMVGEIQVNSTPQGSATSIVVAPNGMVYVGNETAELHSISSVSVIDPSIPISFHVSGAGGVGGGTGGGGGGGGGGIGTSPGPTLFDPFAFVQGYISSWRNFLNSNLLWPINWGTAIGQIPVIGSGVALINSLGLLFDPQMDGYNTILQAQHQFTDLIGGVMKDVPGVGYLGGVAYQQWGDVAYELGYAVNNSSFQDNWNYALQNPWEAAVSGSQAVIDYVPKLVSNLLPKLW